MQAVTAESFLPSLRVELKAKLLHGLRKFGAIDVRWRTDVPVQEFPVGDGAIAFVPCTLVTAREDSRGYTLMTASPFHDMPWSALPCFYTDEQIGPELVSQIALEMAPIFHAPEA